MASDHAPETSDGLKGSGSKVDHEQTTASRASMASFSMAHALNIARRRREEQRAAEEEKSKLEEDKAKLEEEERKERAREKRRRRRKNQKLAKQKAKAELDDKAEDQADSNSDKQSDVNGECDNQRVDKRPREEDSGSEDGQTSKRHKVVPEIDLQEEPKPQIVLVKQQAAATEQLKQPIVKPSTLIPRVLLIKKSAPKKPD